MSKKKNLMRKDLEELYARKAFTQDENRKEAVSKRKNKGFRTARENINDLCDEGSFVEYGSLLLAAQRGRKSMNELMKETPADGLVAGVGTVNGDLFDQAECMILSYDYTVLAGTQGAFNHLKTDRMLGIAQKTDLPIIFFVEGGGGRPGDIDFAPISVAWLDIMTFTEFARLSGKVPRIAIVEGYCFAGNAVLAGCADVIIATENSSMGMGGPSMIEGGGLGKYHPGEVGPAKAMQENGVIDIMVKDEAEAVTIAKKYLSYFQGSVKEWSCEDQSKLRDVLPVDRKYAYDVRKVVDLLADTDSVLEMRRDFGKSMFTALIRIEGRAVGLIANDPRHLGGAIDSDASDKAARFIQLCDSYGLPIVSLCDVPGFMVGPEAEKSGLIRHSSRLFLVGASLKVPFFTIVTRRAYGLGAMAMAGGSLHEPLFTVAWPSGEFGAMGLEGAVKLGFKKELDKISDPDARQQVYDQLVADAYEKGKATNAASVLEIDEVIDPADSRKWIVKLLKSVPNPPKSGRYIDSW